MIAHGTKLSFIRLTSAPNVRKMFARHEIVNIISDATKKKKKGFCFCRQKLYYYYRFTIMFTEKKGVY